MMCLEQNIRIIKRTRKIEQFIGDFFSPRVLTTSRMKQPLHTPRWRVEQARRQNAQGHHALELGSRGRERSACDAVLDTQQQLGWTSHTGTVQHADVVR
jgi:hypothetical protein